MHKHSFTMKADVEFFVKKADKSFGVTILKDGNIVTKLYGSLNRNVYRQDFSIGDLISKKGKVAFKKVSKAEKAEKVTRGKANIQSMIEKAVRKALANIE